MKNNTAKIGHGIEEKRNKAGVITAFKFRTCVARDERHKQIWKTYTIPADDPRIKDLTPKKLKDKLLALKTEWDEDAIAEYNKAKPMIDKDNITFYDFVENHWWKDHVMDGRHSLNSISFFRSTKKTSLDYFGKAIKLSEITPELVKRYLNYLGNDVRTEITDERDIDFTIHNNIRNEAVLTWGKRKNALSYKVYRKGRRAKNYTRIANTNELAYTDRNRTPNNVYDYAVKEVIKVPGKPYSTTSQMHHFGTFRNIMEYAYRLGYIAEDPCGRTSEKERPKRDKKNIDFLAPKDAQHFLSCADNEYREAEKTGELGTVYKAAMWRCYLYLLITTGLRRGEAVGLQWGDIDSDKLTLNICRSVCLDKSSKTKMMIKGTKTGENRKVALLSTVYDMLKEYQGIQRNYFGIDKDETDPTSYIFCGEHDIFTPIYATTPTRYISKFVKRNNLPDVSPHDLRHTAASLALESGAGIKEISELMGHSDIGTTSRFYAALTAEAKRRTVEGIGGLLFGNSQNEQAETT